MSGPKCIQYKNVLAKSAQISSVRPKTPYIYIKNGPLIYTISLYLLLLESCHSDGFPQSEAKPDQERKLR